MSLVNLLNSNEDIKFGFELAQITNYLLEGRLFNFKVKNQYKSIIVDYLKSFNAIYFFEENRVKIIGYLNYN